MMRAFSCELRSLDDTDRLGRALGSVLEADTIIALVGQLGAGKTHFVRAVAEGLGMIELSIVSSPTFVLIQEYSARLPIYHFDAYRLKGDREFRDLGSDEYFRSGGVCLVEWANRVADSLPVDHMRIELTYAGVTARRLSASSSGPQHARILDEWLAELRLTIPNCPIWNAIDSDATE